MGLMFSIVIPSYNQGHFIAETIDSILNQSYKNVEVLVIDGGSTDGTVEVLKKYGDKIFWVSEKDNGQSHAINKGIALAKGEIITFINSDDYYLADAFEKVAERFELDEDVLWLTGDYIIVNERGEQIQSLVGKYKSFFRKFISFRLLSVLNPINQPSTFLTRRIIVRVGGFNENLRYTFDYEFWMNAMSIQKPAILNNKLCAFRMHGSSKGGTEYKQQFKEELTVAKKFQKNHFLVFLHFLHNQLIYFFYAILK